MEDNNSYNFQVKYNQSNPNTNLIDRFISDKIKLLETHINEISKLVDERKSLEEITRSAFTDEILNIRNEVLKIELCLPTYNFQSDPRKTELEKEIIQLEKLKINEKIESWRDVLQLKKDIIDIIMELKKIKNKLDLANNSK
jgi:hypothetical protein